MGCDIHLVVERRVNDKWIAVRTFGHVHTNTPGTDGLFFETPAAIERNYERFAALAGVRGDGPGARGLPTDVSDTSKLLFETIGDHTPSWLPLDDASRLFLKTEHSYAFKVRAASFPVYEYFGIEPERDGPVEDHRVVFWFDS